MNNVLSYFIAFSLIVIVFSYKNDSSEHNNTTSLKHEESAISLKTEINKLYSIYDSKASGLDLDNNGIRDDLEHIVYQALDTLDNSDSNASKHIKSIINMIQPNDPLSTNNIDEREIYCSYQNLSKNIQKELPLKFIYDIVLNTPDRKKSFNDSLTNPIGNLEEINCK